MRASAASRFSFSSSTISSGALATNFSLASLASTRLMSASALAISFSSRVRSAATIDHALQRQRRDLAAHQQLHRAFRRAVGEGDVGQPRHALDDVAPARRALLGLGRGAGQHQRRQRRRRNVHLRAHRADRGDEVDHPADLGFGRGIGEVGRLEDRQRSRTGGCSGSVGHAPQASIGKLLSASARSASRGHGASTSRPSRLAVTAHSSSVMKGMNGCSSFRISSRAQATMARVSALAGAVLAQQHRLCELEIPVAIDVPDEAIDRIRPHR